YHAWSYGRDGRLASAPRMPKERVAGCRLHEFRSTIWRGFVYVDLSGEAPPLDLAGLDELIEPYDQPKMRFAHVEREVWRCNWKLLVENFMEAYHLSVVHPETLHPYTPTALSRYAGAGDGFTAYVAHYPDDIDQRFAGAPHLTREERYQSRLFCVFPTHLASQSAGLLVSLALDPVAVGETHVRWTLSAYEGELDADGVADAVALWREVNREDREKLEAMQGGLGSVAATSGPLAPPDLEGTIADFHRFLARPC
ncbi:MAG: SRPBCC family protein, partial [Pseudomonadota bacterium]